jgi:hypothetical protein
MVLDTLEPVMPIPMRGETHTRSAPPRAVPERSLGLVGKLVEYTPAGANEPSGA